MDQRTIPLTVLALALLALAGTARTTPPTPAPYGGPPLGWDQPSVCTLSDAGASSSEALLMQ